MSWFINLSGKRFGRLVVLCRLSKRSWGSLLWKCKCDCGELVNINGASLRYGRTLSCGCLMRELCSKANTRTDAARNKVWSMYLNHAHTLSLTFKLSAKQFDKLIFGKCYYCDLPPSRVSTSFAGKSILCSGIDRLDSNVGYTKYNCVSCCKVCNLMKKAYTLEFFLSHVTRIADNMRRLHGRH
jgi:hypothetical protein